MMLRQIGLPTRRDQGALPSGEKTSDTGMSLVELIVAVVISGILLSVVAIIFGQGLSAQQQQASRDSATGQLNAASAFLNESMRSAVSARVADSNSRLDMKVLNASGTGFECRSWKIQSDSLWYSGGSGPRGVWDASGWSELAAQVVNRLDGTANVGFSINGGSFSYVLNVRDGDVEVVIRDGGYPGAKSTLGGSGCW